MQEGFLGEQSLGEKYMGEKYVQEEFLGEESLDLYYISTITYEHKVNIY